MLKNITFTVEESLIERAQRKAEAEGATLDAEFRRWLERYANRPQTAGAFRELMAQLSYAQPGRAFSRDEMEDFQDGDELVT